APLETVPDPTAWRVPLAAAVVFIAVLVGLLFFVGRRARRAVGDERTPAWFGFWRTYRLAIEGGWVLWLVLVFGLSLGDRLPAALPQVPDWLLWFAALFLPPMVVIFAGHMTARLVRSRLHEAEGTTLDAALESAGGLLARLVPLLCGLIALWSALDERSAGPPSLWLLLAVVSVVASRVLLRRSTGLVLQALSEGELRDRAFALAAKGSV